MLRSPQLGDPPQQPTEALLIDFSVEPDQGDFHTPGKELEALVEMLEKGGMFIIPCEMPLSIRRPKRCRE